MAIERKGPRGARVWVNIQPKVKALYFWLELGKRNAQRFVQGGTALAALCLKIPQPYGMLVAAVAGAQVNDIKGNANPDYGVWVKFGPFGYVKSRPRTEQNMAKPPSPW